MRPSFLVPARDKAEHVERCAQSILAQTYPCDIFLSDQGSIDGTREILASLVSGYKGHHRVYLMDCPDTDPKGMAGLNAHLRWLHEQCAGDLVLMTSADDIAHPLRTERVVEVFKEFNPSFVGTAQEFTSPEGEVTGITAFPLESRFVTAREHLFQLTGSSCSTAWARDLVDKYQPFEKATGSDVTLPFYAALERGFYYIYEPLHAYIYYADPNNTGLEGAIRAAEKAGDDAKRMQIAETACYQIMSAFQSMYWKLIEHHGEDDGNDAMVALCERMLAQGLSWTNARDNLTGQRIPPIPLNV